MLISHRKRFIYTKTIKTAGTSVEAYFEPYCFPENAWEFSHDCGEYTGETGIVGRRGSDKQGSTWFNHMSAKLVRKQIGDTIWNEYFKFCVVRNPFDQLVSAFHYRESKYDPNTKKFPRSRTFRDSNEKFLAAIHDKSPVERFRIWIAWGGVVGDRNKYMIDDEFCMDYFIRFESLQTDIQQVCATLDIPFEPEKMMRLKSGTRPKELRLSDYYDAKTIDLVVQQYHREISRFGYEPPA